MDVPSRLRVKAYQRTVADLNPLAIALHGFDARIRDVRCVLQGAHDSCMLLATTRVPAPAFDLLLSPAVPHNLATPAATTALVPPQQTSTDIATLSEPVAEELTPVVLSSPGSSSTSPAPPGESASINGSYLQPSLLGSLYRDVSTCVDSCALRPITIWLLAFESAQERITHLVKGHSAYKRAHGIQSRTRLYEPGHVMSKAEEKRKSIISKFEDTEAQVRQQLRWLADNALCLQQQALRLFYESYLAVAQALTTQGTTGLLPFPKELLGLSHSSAPEHAMSAAAEAIARASASHPWSPLSLPPAPVIAPPTMVGLLSEPAPSPPVVQPPVSVSQSSPHYTLSDTTAAVLSAQGSLEPPPSTGHMTMLLSTSQPVPSPAPPPPQTGTGAGETPGGDAAAPPWATSPHTHSAPITTTAGPGHPSQSVEQVLEPALSERWLPPGIPLDTGPSAPRATYVGSPPPSPARRHDSLGGAPMPTGAGVDVGAVEVLGVVVPHALPHSNTGAMDSGDADEGTVEHGDSAAAEESLSGTGVQEQETAGTAPDLLQLVDQVWTQELVGAAAAGSGGGGGGSVVDDSGLARVSVAGEAAGEMGAHGLAVSEVATGDMDLGGGPQGGDLTPAPQQQHRDSRSGVTGGQEAVSAAAASIEQSMGRKVMWPPPVGEVSVRDLVQAMESGSPQTVTPTAAASSVDTAAIMTDPFAQPERQTAAAHTTSQRPDPAATASGVLPDLEAVLARRTSTAVGPADFLPPPPGTAESLPLSPSKSRAVAPPPELVGAVPPLALDPDFRLQAVRAHSAAFQVAQAAAHGVMLSPAPLSPSWVMVARSEAPETVHGEPGDTACGSTGAVGDRAAGVLTGAAGTSAGSAAPAAVGAGGDLATGREDVDTVGGGVALIADHDLPVYLRPDPQGHVGMTVFVHDDTVDTGAHESSGRAATADTIPAPEMQRGGGVAQASAAGVATDRSGAQHVVGSRQPLSEVVGLQEGGRGLRSLERWDASSDTHSAAVLQSRGPEVSITASVAALASGAAGTGPPAPASAGTANSPAGPESPDPQSDSRAPVLTTAGGEALVPGKLFTGLLQAVGVTPGAATLGTRGEAAFADRDLPATTAGETTLAPSPSRERQAVSSSEDLVASPHHTAPAEPLGGPAVLVSLDVASETESVASAESQVHTPQQDGATVRLSDTDQHSRPEATVFPALAVRAESGNLLLPGTVPPAGAPGQAGAVSAMAPLLQLPTSDQPAPLEQHLMPCHASVTSTPRRLPQGMLSQQLSQAGSQPPSLPTTPPHTPPISAYPPLAAHAAVGLAEAEPAWEHPDSPLPKCAIPLTYHPVLLARALEREVEQGHGGAAPDSEDGMRHAWVVPGLLGEQQSSPDTLPDSVSGVVQSLPQLGSRAAGSCQPSGEPRPADTAAPLEQPLSTGQRMDADAQGAMHTDHLPAAQDASHLAPVRPPLPATHLFDSPFSAPPDAAFRSQAHPELVQLDLPHSPVYAEDQGTPGRVAPAPARTLSSQLPPTPKPSQDLSWLGPAQAARTDSGGGQLLQTLSSQPSHALPPTPPTSPGQDAAGGVEEPAGEPLLGGGWHVLPLLPEGTDVLGSTAADEAAALAAGPFNLPTMVIQQQRGGVGGGSGGGSGLSSPRSPMGVRGAGSVGGASSTAGSGTLRQLGRTMSRHRRTEVVNVPRRTASTAVKKNNE